MVNREVELLVDRFRRIELHSAQSGRAVLSAFSKLILESKETTLPGLTEELHENIRFLLPELPPYAPPLNNINKILLLFEQAPEMGWSVEELKGQIDLIDRDKSNPTTNCELIAQHLQSNLPPDVVVYTHTLSETVLGVLLELHRKGLVKAIKVTESRPNNDGWETARRLAESDLPVHLTIDAAIPGVIEEAHLMLSGAEIINQDGSVVGKIGAYLGAVFCNLFDKPLFIVADSNKFNQIQWTDFNFNPINAKDIGINISNPSLKIAGSFFDVTPPHLISAYATEVGIIKASEIPSILPDTKTSGWLLQQLERG